MRPPTAPGDPGGPRRVIGTVLLLIGLPLTLALIEAAVFHARNRSNGVIISSGQEREYLLYVPGSYDQRRPTSLVISLHGGALWPAAQMAIDRWNRTAERHGFIVVYPAGVGGRGPRHWEADGGPGQAREVRFIAELIDTLSARYAIDRTRIYANGLSNGGGMAFVLACTLSDRIAAIGMVATAIFLRWRECPDQRPVPVIVFHGTADRAAPYAGGRTWVAPVSFPSIPAWAAQWARRNRCASGPIDSALAADVTLRRYADCAEGAAVALYTVHGGGHTWPGGRQVPEWGVGPTSRTIHATDLMWAFFRAHPLPGAQAARHR